MSEKHLAQILMTNGFFVVFFNSLAKSRYRQAKIKYTISSDGIGTNWKRGRYQTQHTKFFVSNLNRTRDIAQNAKQHISPFLASLDQFDDVPFLTGWKIKSEAQWQLKLCPVFVYDTMKVLIFFQDCNLIYFHVIVCQTWRNGQNVGRQNRKICQISFQCCQSNC